MNIAQQSSFSHFRLARLKRMCRFSSCDQQRCRIWSSYFDENWEILTINSFKKHSHHLWCPCTFRRRFLPLHALPAQHFSSANFIQLYNLEVYIFFIWSWDRVYPEFGYTHPELMYTVGLKVGIGDGIGIGDKAGSYSLLRGVLKQTFDRAWHDFNKTWPTNASNNRNVLPILSHVTLCNVFLMDNAVITI